MFISALELFKIGIGPSSSHTMGPMLAAHTFIQSLKHHLPQQSEKHQIRCTLKGSLSATGKGHATDRAVALGLHGYLPKEVADHDLDVLTQRIWSSSFITIHDEQRVAFCATSDIIFDTGKSLPEHPNGMIFELLDDVGNVIVSETYFSIGGGFVNTASEIKQLVAPLKMKNDASVPYAFDNAQVMLDMAEKSGMSIAAMKQTNETQTLTQQTLDDGLDKTWQAMTQCIKRGLNTEGILPGGLEVARRAKQLSQKLAAENNTNMNDWLCAYAMAVNEENAAGHMVVTAPTNGAAGVIPAVLYYFINHEKGTAQDVRDFLLTASAIGGIIKHNSSISGAEVGCQGEVGSAAAMAAAGLCAVRGGTPAQVEHAAEMALEHHLGMTCDPVGGLVQVPCIERNGFGAIKAYTAASLAMHGTGEHFMSLDNCIAAMKQTGEEMSVKFKETSLGGLAVTIVEC
ncbi:MAG TPA: L-serine ammonia-lyase [Mariprofundaceae bacterium]|nr:L-serine ammonia-lyase [Mariprofundaceae bacterium]